MAPLREEDSGQGTASSCDSDKRKTCSISAFHIFLNRTFYHFGKHVANHKGYYIIIPIFLTVLGITGIQNINYEDDPEYLFAPSTGAARSERANIEEFFTTNFTYLFDPGRITRTGRHARFVVTAKNGGTVFTKEIFDNILELDAIVKNVTVKDGNRIYEYKHLCAIKGSKCFPNGILAVAPIIKQIENKSAELLYPINFEPFLLPHFIGGVKTRQKGEVLDSAEAIQLAYYIRNSDANEDKRAEDWEQKILTLFGEKDFERIKVAYITSRSIEDELENNTNSVKPFVGVTVTIMTAFSVIVCIMSDSVRAKPWLGLMGIIIAIMSSFTAFGFLMYVGVPFIGINMAAPFLMLGIGIDDTFVMLAAWRRTRLQDTVSQRLAESYSEAAVSITITSLTDMISFFIGILTPFPSVQIFCIYTGTAVIFTYLWHITLFGALVAISGAAEKNQRHSLICIKVAPKSQAGHRNILYRIFCAGGINHEDPWNPKDNEPHLIMRIFRDYVGKCLNIPAMKTFVICIFVLYLGGGIFGCTKVREGLEKKRLSRYDSYSVDFYNAEDKYFRVFPYSIQAVITGDVTYSDPETKKDFMELLETFENQTYINGQYTQSVIRYWYNFLHDNDAYLEFNISDEKSFIYYLREIYVADPLDVFNLDISYNEDYTKILATRMVLQTYKLDDSNDDKNMMQGLREIAANSKFNVTVFNPYFVFFDQYVLVKTLTIQAISLAAVVMMFVCLVFIPNPWCSMWVAFSVISIEIGVIGYMSMWDVNLDSISMINLIMCIGFSVDFSAHISYAYLTAKAQTPDERVRECLYGLGLPILQGGVSTILGVVALNFAPSYIFVTFFKIVFLVIFFGIMHGIFLLPVLLSLVGPGSFSRKPDDDIYDPDIPPTLEFPKATLQPKPKQKQIPPAIQPPYLYPLNGKGVIGSHEKDMGIGTSGEDSSEVSSVEARHSPVREMEIVEVRNGSRPRRTSEYPMKATYSNHAYDSDEEIFPSSFPASSRGYPFDQQDFHEPRSHKYTEKYYKTDYEDDLRTHKRDRRNEFS